MVNQTATSRNPTDGKVTPTTTATHAGVAYRQGAKKEALGLNPSISAMLLLKVSDGYRATVKDTITHDGRTDQVLSVHTVTLPSGVAYQVVGV